MILQLEVSFYKLGLTACFLVCKSQIMALLINAEFSLATPYLLMGGWWVRPAELNNGMCFSRASQPDGSSVGSSIPVLLS